MQIKSPEGGTFIHMDGKVESLPVDWESAELGLLGVWTHELNRCLHFIFYIFGTFSFPNK